MLGAFLPLVSFFKLVKRSFIVYDKQTMRIAFGGNWAEIYIFATPEKRSKKLFNFRFLSPLFGKVLIFQTRFWSNENSSRF